MERTLTKEEIYRALAARHGEELQRKIAGSTVAVCGLGGLGSHLALCLARMGIGKLILIDSVALRFFCLNRRDVMVRINGKEYELSGETLACYLAVSEYDSRRIAVERNGEIVPKSLYEQTVLKDGDSLEVVTFVGGG